MIDDPQRQVTAFMAVLPAVENTLGCIPRRSAHNGIMVIRLEILILFPVILFRLVVFIVRGIGFPGQHITTVLFIPQSRYHAVAGPMCV